MFRIRVRSPSAVEAPQARGCEADCTLQTLPGTLPPRSMRSILRAHGDAGAAPDRDFVTVVLRWNQRAWDATVMAGLLDGRRARRPDRRHSSIYKRGRD
ncbi:MAG: hypothetical protein JNL98_01480 [Bryobacterales bacterium]|nr:hypothetical protein [Bryobacterales bacterium]